MELPHSHESIDQRRSVERVDRGAVGHGEAMEPVKSVKRMEAVDRRPSAARSDNGTSGPRPTNPDVATRLTSALS